ncbi:hypothetical protein [Rhizobium laguerreae]|uniref:hypothetical protein n=1 Tax=Rhizobium laguerreae TaxID=1076926 RepID=UPI003009C206
MLATALRRAGQTPEEVANSMRAAADDGQDMFNVADALGYTGERLTSTATRVPHEGRQALAEVLMTRQAGQGERLANNLAEGFDTFDTAGRRVADRTAQRTAEANELYPATRSIIFRMTSPLIGSFVLRSTTSEKDVWKFHSSSWPPVEYHSHSRLSFAQTGGDFKVSRKVPVSMRGSPTRMRGYISCYVLWQEPFLDFDGGY